VHAEPEQDRIQYSVIDTGIGIALEDLKQLFIPFKQVDSSLTRDYEGTGLGLALVQKLTDLHGGSVNVESEVGKGSRFTINLPLGRAMWAQLEVNETDGELLLSKRTGNSNTPVEEPLDHGIVLLAEDNLANILTIGDYLESHGYQVVVAHDGLEAMEKAGEIKPNIILMDIQMPAMDGLEAIRRLRMDPGFASTPIIALTALAMPSDRERSLKAGANEYMSKPVSLKEMVNNIRQLLSKEE
jgi:CheY-like chemotaxis protein